MQRRRARGAHLVGGSFRGCPKDCTEGDTMSTNTPRFWPTIAEPQPAADGPPVLVAGAFRLLAVAFWVFQVAQHEKFDQMAENNHLRRLPLPAPRGRAVRSQRQGAGREPEHLQHRAGARADGNLDQTLRTLAAATGADEAELRRR